MPTGDGIGAAHAGWEVMSPARAAPSMLIFTVPEAFAIMPGPAGTQLGSMQGFDLSVILAAAFLSIFTLVEPGGMMSSGSAGWATGVGVGAAGWMGAWQWGASCFILSPTRAAALAAMNAPPGKGPCLEGALGLTSPAASTHAALSVGRKA